jgi:cyclopropane-fatty-acyl-phospholipid synthase
MTTLNMKQPFGIGLVERDILPDTVIRLAIRRMVAAQAQRMSRGGDANAQQERLRALLPLLRQGPIAVHTHDANQQHYELPTAFFSKFLGARMKYSACHWPDGVQTLEQAEDASLSLYCARAGVADGMEILELGCGWGALSLWLAEKYPHSRILAVSNSRTQREYITQQAAARGLGNLEVQTADMNDFATTRRFDRVMSIEMFEHMRNYECLMEQVASFLKPGGKLFAQIFAGTRFGYAVNTDTNWLARYFFAGGTMPAADMLLYFQRDLLIADHWRENGAHYTRTLEAWLRRYDAERDAILPILAATYGQGEQTRWWVRWRLFFIGCAELMAHRGGNEYVVGHYLFEKRG